MYYFSNLAKIRYKNTKESPQNFAIFIIIKFGGFALNFIKNC